MGYCTRFTLALYDREGRDNLSGDVEASVIADLRSSYEEADYCLDENGLSEEMGKWYQHEEDFRSFSKANPEILFVLSGEGEESGDIWKKYFLAGKCQVEKAKVVIAPFDPKKLT